MSDEAKGEAKGFSLSDFDLAGDAERGATVALTNPRTGVLLVADDGAPVTVTVKGADGRTYRRAQVMAQKEIAEVSDTSRITYLDPDARDALIDQQTSKVLAAVTMSWHGIALAGEVWECTPEAAEALYQRFDWIKRQVDAAVSNRMVFFTEGLPSAA